MKKLLSLLLCLTTLVAMAGMSLAEEDFLTTIQGSYVELFPEMAKEEYRDEWQRFTAPLVGEENADATIDALLSMCMAESYGAEAAALYADAPESMRFNCFFLGGVKQFVFAPGAITGLDESGEVVFSHSYESMDVESDTGFLFYRTEESDAGQFTYFAFAPDTMEETYHLEFRYSDDFADLQSWFEGDYAYWNVGAISADYTDEIITKAIELFATENLSAE